MPRFEPFRAVRYAAGTDLAQMTSPPYDVLNDDEILELSRRDAHNIVRIDDPLVVHSDAADAYAASAGVLSSWLAEGVLRVDDAPSFTIHRMSFTDAAGVLRETVGVLGGLEVGPYGHCGVLPHERITPKASTDRLDLTRATRANLSPVWGLALGSGLTDVLTEPGELVGTLTADGVTHTLERVTDTDRQRRISHAVSHDDVLIADGHHRYGVAQTMRAEDASPGASLTLAYVAELAPDQLHVSAIHRVYRDVDAAQLRTQLARSFAFTAAPDPDAETLREMERRGALLWLSRSGTHLTSEWMTPLPGRFDEVRAIDGAWLEDALAGTGVQPDYQHEVAEVLHDVRTDPSGRTAAVLINPVTLAEILRTGREGLVMPPKSTFFTPKLPTGLVIRLLNA